MGTLSRAWPCGGQDLVASPNLLTQYDPTRPLAFMHIPKTAGSSLLAALSHAVAPATVAFAFDRVLFGDFEDFASFDDAVQRVVHLWPHTLPDVGVIAGHVALSSLRARYPGAQLVTVLREPVSRLLSHWLFWRGHSDERLAEWGAWADHVRLSRLSLEEFLASPSLACQNDNVATRLLLWPHALIPTGDFIDPRHDASLVAAARAALAGFDLTGTVEAADWPGRLEQWLGRKLAVARTNETLPLSPPLQGCLPAELTDATASRIRRCCRLDLQLWQDFGREGYPDMDAFRHGILRASHARYAALLSGAEPSRPAGADGYVLKNHV